MNCVLTPQPDGLHRCESCGFTRRLTVAPELYRRRCPGRANEKPAAPAGKPCGTCGPGILRTAANAVAAAGRVVGAVATGQPVLVDAATKAARLAICGQCDRRSGPLCDACGCFVEAKAALATEDCPKGRWTITLATAQRPLFRLTHGLGDSIQFTVAVRHLRHYFPGRPIAVQVADSVAPFFARLVDAVYRETQAVPAGAHDYVEDCPWVVPIGNYLHSPSTKAENWLRHHGLVPIPALCRYLYAPTIEANQAAASYLAECDATGRAVLIHHTGRTARARKLLPDSVWMGLIARLTSAGLVPIVLDWECHGRPGTAVGAPGTFTPGRGHWLWHGWNLADVQVLAALASQAACCVGIDSGPGHVFVASGAPTVLAWTRHHPINYSPVAANVVHVVPEGHARWTRGPLRFFDAHYAAVEYGAGSTLLDALSAQVLGLAAGTAMTDPGIRQQPAVVDADLRVSLAGGVAWQASPERVEYGSAYWDKYVAYAATERGAVLRRQRFDLAAKYARTVLDVGVGCGDFIQHWRGGHAWGWDVSEQGRNWLADCGALVEPTRENLAGVQAVTAWDTFEHLEQPSRLLDAMHPGQYLILSLPVFGDLRRVRESRHYRPGEHLTYWTPRGLTQFLDAAGFRLVGSHDRETTEAGREAIGSYVFRKRPYDRPAKTALITGGIGDWFAIEQLLTGEQRDALEKVFYATRAHREIRKLWAPLGGYPKLGTHVTLVDDWSNRFCFVSKWELGVVTGMEIPAEADWSIGTIFPLVGKGAWQCRQSSLLLHKQADLPPGLPDKYIAIQSTSPNDRSLPRDIQEREWPAVQQWAADRGLPLVSIDITEGYTLPQAIEILKHASGYIGIDSCFSVLAARLFTPDMLRIRSVNKHLHKNVHAYYPTQEPGPWVSRSFV